MTIPINGYSFGAGLDSPFSSGYTLFKDEKTGKLIKIDVNGNEVVEEEQAQNEETNETEESNNNTSAPGDSATFGAKKKSSEDEILEALAEGQAAIDEIENNLKPIIPNTNTDTEEGRNLLNEGNEILEDAAEFKRKIQNNPDDAEEIAKAATLLSQKSSDAQEEHTDFNTKTEEEKEKETAEIVAGLDGSTNNESEYDLSYLQNALNTFEMPEEEADEDIETEV